MTPAISDDFIIDFPAVLTFEVLLSEAVFCNYVNRTFFVKSFFLLLINFMRVLN